MKRRTVTLLIGCAALMLCAVVLRNNWLWIAYEPDDSYTSIDVYRISADWLPGPILRVPDQVCHSCRFARRIWKNEDHLEFCQDGGWLGWMPTQKSDFAEIEKLEGRCICQQCFPGRTAR